MMSDKRKRGGQPGAKRANYYAAFLKEWREAKGLTMDELAKASGVAYGTVWKLENEQHVTRRVMERLAAALDITVSQLGTEHPPRGNQPPMGD